MRHIGKKYAFCFGGGYCLSLSFFGFLICDSKFLIFLLNYLNFHLHMTGIFGNARTVTSDDF